MPRTRSSYIRVPRWLSTAIARSAASASVVLLENGVGAPAPLAKLVTAIWSAGGFASTKALAAALAVASGGPAIDCERSIASRTLFELPRLSGASARLTGWPFSSSVGALSVG